MPVNEEGIHHLLSWDGDVGRTILERVAIFEQVVRADAPIRPDNPGVHLAETIGHAIEPGEKLSILVGTNADEDIRGYSVIVQTGSRPHEILPRTPGGYLKFKMGGRTVYRRRVFHPGTQPDPFLMRHIEIITS